MLPQAPVVACFWAQMKHIIASIMSKLISTVRLIGEADGDDDAEQEDEDEDEQQPQASQMSGTADGVVAIWGKNVYGCERR